MEIVQQLSKPILELGDKVGKFLIPILIVAPILLLILSIYSYRALKVVLPAGGLIVGYVIGSKVLGPIIASSFEGFGFITPALIGGVIFAVLFSFFCFKDKKTTILIIGLTVGYLAISKLVHITLRSTEFVKQILLNTPMEKAIIFSTIISITCALIMMYLCKKHFTFTYIFGVSLTTAIAAFAVPAVFIFKNSANFEKGVIAFAAIGAFLGLIFSWKQFKKFRYMCD